MEDRWPIGSNLDRREFFRLALSAAVISAARLNAESGTNLQAPEHATFFSLAPGAVQPEGWLRKYMVRQAELCAKLPEISWPFTEQYWNGMEDADAWWPWEQVAYWIDGATRLALVLQDDSLMAEVRKRIDFTLSHAGRQGFLGPQFLEFSIDTLGEGYRRWPHTIFFRSLAALHDAQSENREGSEDIARAMQAHFLSDRRSIYTEDGRNITNIESMLWCYERTGDPRLLEMAEDSWQGFLSGARKETGFFKPEADVFRKYADLSPARVRADEPIQCHGVTYAETMKLPAILYLYTGKEEYLKFAQAAEQRIFDHHMLIDGIPSTSEVYRTTTSLDQHETCDIADHTWSWGYMLMATGNGIWADRIERACFNAAPGAIRNDWKALQYLSSPNQFLATLDSDHGFMRHGGRLMAYQPNPGQYTACCGGNVHRIFPNYAMRMWMKSREGGLAAVLYGPSRITARVGDRGEKVEILQTTSYPFDETIQFKIESDHPITFPLSLRIPRWCQEPKLTVNGATVRLEATEGGFAILHRTFSPGDLIVLTLPMKIALSHWPEHGIGIERGPLVYALPIVAQWSAVVEPQYTTAEFPSWEATPTTPWNYGLALRPEEVAAKIEVKKHHLSADELDEPWANPSTTLTVPMQKIENWTLRSGPHGGNQKLTPPLPDMATSTVSSTIEALALVPYGSTQLRLTIFPTILRDAEQKS